MDSYSLKDKKVLITGASSGIGKQAAITISEMGGKAIITARDKNKLKETFDRLKGEGHQMIIADLTKEEELNTLVSGVSGLDGIVQCAGLVQPVPIKFITRKHIDEMYNINYFAPVLLTGKLLKEKKISNGASIVFISSVSSQFGYIGGALYCGSKSGIDQFSKVLAIEAARQKIRSNTINAAMVKTAVLEQAQQLLSKESITLHEKKYPLGFGEPLDIAKAIVFLLSDASGWITGTSLIVDGGLTAGDF